MAFFAGAALNKVDMVHSRRDFLKTAAVAATCATAAQGATASTSLAPAASPVRSITPEQIIALFDGLPGDVAVKIFAPGTAVGAGFLAQSNSAKRLFAASSIKTFVLGEALRQIDSANVVEQLDDREVALDSTVWSFGSPTFNPPNVTGVVSERTVLDAMINHSDNTATDMAFKLAGADNVRALIASQGLVNTLVPDSTRALTGYLFGATDYKNLTWEQLQAAVQNPQVHPFLNDVQTLASSVDDLVTWYSRALQGAFFKHPETLNEFRRVLSLCDFIYLIPLPSGVSAYIKSGNADTPGFHARAIAGGMFFSGQWVYFAFLINWYAESATDPETVERLYGAINTALTQVRDALSSPRSNSPRGLSKT
ncbi:MAG: serine hydrolase [Dokdonella sp.]